MKDPIKCEDMTFRSMLRSRMIWMFAPTGDGSGWKSTYTTLPGCPIVKCAAYRSRRYGWIGPDEKLCPRCSREYTGNIRVAIFFGLLPFLLYICWPLV